VSWGQPSRRCPSGKVGHELAEAGVGGQLVDQQHLDAAIEGPDPAEHHNCTAGSTTVALCAKAGDTVELSVDGDSTKWRVAGIAEERSDAGGAYVTAAGLAKALEQPQWSNTLRIATDSHDEKTREAVAKGVDDLLTRGGIQVKSAESVSRQEAATGGTWNPS
jgi:hypothetical protein